MYKLRRLHFIGIGGSGMSGIAQVLHNLDYDISGSDVSANAATRALEQSGARIAIGHDAGNVEGAEAVVFLLCDRAGQSRAAAGAPPGPADRTARHHAQ